MKWPDDLEFGEQVLILTIDTVEHAGGDTINLTLSDFEQDDPSLLAILRIPT